jgi:hypothetical protein
MYEEAPMDVDLGFSLNLDVSWLEFCRSCLNHMKPTSQLLVQKKNDAWILWTNAWILIIASTTLDNYVVEDSWRLLNAQFVGIIEYLKVLGENEWGKLVFILNYARIPEIATLQVDIRSWRIKSCQ